ncbi:hypothetical protein BDW22DRAFT_1350065 [Trametopsis cervina]|nr:hypothetical protein BDW22DRAFT_1350065 [Trametopsis cervina]
MATFSSSRATLFVVCVLVLICTSMGAHATIIPANADEGRHRHPTRRVSRRSKTLRSDVVESLLKRSYKSITYLDSQMSAVYLFICMMNEDTMCSARISIGYRVHESSQ